MFDNPPRGPRKDLLPDHVAQQIVEGMSPLERELFVHLGGMELLRRLKDVADVEGNRHQEFDLIARLWRGAAQDASDLARGRTRLRVLQNRLNKSLAKSGCALLVWRPEPGQLLLSSVGRRSLAEKIGEEREKVAQDLIRMFDSPEEQARALSEDNNLPAKKEPSKLQRAKDFLTGILGDKEVGVKAVQAWAVHNNISIGTLRRARKALGIVKGREGFGPKGRWRISLPRCEKCVSPHQPS